MIVFDHNSIIILFAQIGGLWMVWIDVLLHICFRLVNFKKMNLINLLVKMKFWCVWFDLMDGDEAKKC